MPKYINFKLVKRQLSFETVFAHYGLEVKPDGEAHVKMCCPFHDDNRPSLGVDTDKKIWQCFACSASGNILEFVTRMEGHNPDDKDGIRKGAEAANAMIGRAGHSESKQPKPNKSDPPVEKETSPPIEESAVETGSNTPLNFELKLDPCHKMLRERGVDKSVSERFGIGYCKRGMMKNRIVFPLREPDGTLVGYAGRWTENTLPEETPRYLLPTGLNKSHILWNWDRVRTWECDHVVIVEGFWSVLRLDQLDIPTVALLGHTLFESQIEMLVSGGVTHVTLIMDGDEAGRDATMRNIAALAPHLFVKALLLADDIKPDSMSDGILKTLPTCK